VFGAAAEANTAQQAELDAARRARNQGQAQIVTYNNASAELRYMHCAEPEYDRYSVLADVGIETTERHRYLGYKLGKTSQELLVGFLMPGIRLGVAQQCQYK
jgi:hypothetical protein